MIVARKTAFIVLAALGLVIASMEFNAIKRAWHFYRSAKVISIVVQHVEAKLKPQTCGIECANLWDAEVQLAYQRNQNTPSKKGILTYSGYKEELEFKVEVLKSLKGHSAPIYVSDQQPDAISIEPPSFPWPLIFLLAIAILLLICPAIIAFLPISRTK
jgi:hypothetical protein